MNEQSAPPADPLSAPGHRQDERPRRQRRTGRQQGLQPHADEREPACPCRRRSCSRRTSVVPIEDNGRRLPRRTEELLQRGVAILEQATNRTFGGSRRPLLLSVRSGAAVSMPGMLDTDPQHRSRRRHRSAAASRDRRPDLRLGLVSPVHPDLRRGRGRMPIRTVRCGDRGGARPRRACRRSTSSTSPRCGSSWVVSKTCTTHSPADPFPQDPMDQLVNAVESVLRSWFAPRAVDYRQLGGLDDQAGTAVTVQSMVFGNMGMSSGSGVGFTRDPASGEDRLYVDFLLNAQGEDIVAGSPPRGRLRTSSSPTVPGLAHQLQRVRPAARSALPRRPGLRVHRRGRHPVDAPDPQSQANTARGATNRLRPRRRGPHRSEHSRGTPGRLRPRHASSTARLDTDVAAHRIAASRPAVASPRAEWP